MANYTTPKITPSIFNSSDYIDASFLTKTQADSLYINELPESVEKLIGNLNIIGEETVTSQVVTGNSTIGGNENITGTITAGSANNAVGNEFKHSGIHGNVWLGDSVTNTTTTVLNKLTVGGNGYKDINLNGAITNINTLETSSSTQLNIGRAGSVHTTTIKGHVNLGDENNAGVVKALGAVTLGWAKPIDIRGSTVAINIESNSGTTTIGNGTNAINLNSTNVVLGNDNTSSVTQIKGKTIAIGNTPGGSGIQIGAGGLVANASGGQTNTFVSTQNKIFNPRLCDAYGNLLGQGFNLNNPSHFVFNQNLKYANNAYTYCDTSTVKNIVFYLNTPSLIANQCYTMCFEFFYYLIGGKGVTGGASVTPSTGTLTGTYSGTASKVIQSCFMLVLAKSSGSDGTYTFSCINTTQSSNPFVAFTHSGAVTGTTTTPLGFSKGTTDGRIKINIQFPQMTTNTYSTSADFIISMGCSLRLCNSNVNGVDLTGNGQGLYPNNSADSFGGTAFFSLS